MFCCCFSNYMHISNNYVQAKLYSHIIFKGNEWPCQLDIKRVPKVQYSLLHLKFHITHITLNILILLVGHPLWELLPWYLMVNVSREWPSIVGCLVCMRRDEVSPTIHTRCNHWTVPCNRSIVVILGA